MCDMFSFFGFCFNFGFVMLFCFFVFCYFFHSGRNNPRASTEMTTTDCELSSPSPGADLAIETAQKLHELTSGGTQGDGKDLVIMLQE